MARRTSPNRCLRAQPKHEEQWTRAKKSITQDLDALEFEYQVNLLFILLDTELTVHALAIAYFSAVEDESLSFLLSRIVHEGSRTA
jgi:hypothetical protein